MPQPYSVMVREFVEDKHAAMVINYDGKVWEIVILWDDEKIYVKNIGYYDAMQQTYQKIKYSQV